MPVKPLETLSLSKLALPSVLLVLLLPSLSGAVGQAGTPPPTPRAAARPEPPTPPPAPSESHRGWLGVTLSDDEDEGVTVTGVREDSPAQKAGIQEGDQILELDGKRIERSGDIRRRTRPWGRSIARRGRHGGHEC